MLFSKEEIKKRDLMREKRYWQKELKNKKSRYSEYWCIRQIEEIERLQEL